MAKKKTRSSTRTAAPRIAEAEAIAPMKTGNLETEYHYVIRDLRQIAIIAGVLVMVLVVLSFVI